MPETHIIPCIFSRLVENQFDSFPTTFERRIAKTVVTLIFQCYDRGIVIGNSRSIVEEVIDLSV